MIAGESERVEEDEVGVEAKGDEHLGDDNMVVGRDADRKREVTNIKLHATLKYPLMKLVE